MIRVLVTGFEPFGGSDINPSGQIIRRLTPVAGVATPIRVGDGITVEVTTLELPCDFVGAGPLLTAAIDRGQPDAVISFGQGGGASVAVERVGINLQDPRMADNQGYQPEDTSVEGGGPVACMATLPVKAIVRALNSGGVPARLSQTAGAFLCNHVMYVALRHLAETGRADVPAGFIHVPKLPQQVATDDYREKEPSMAIETLDRAARIALGVVAQAVLERGGAPAQQRQRQPVG